MTTQPFPIERRAFTPEVRGLDEETREVTHLISTAALDRAGDVVEPKGWDVKNYLRNPVVLVDHEYSVRSIIGRATKLETTDEGLVATTRFHDKGLGAEAFELVKAGMAHAWSVGFTPIDHEPLRDDKGVVRGFHFKRQELLEYSLVAVPMNPEAVLNAVSRGLLSKSNVDRFFRPPKGEPARSPVWDAIAARVARSRPRNFYDEILK